MQLEVALGGFAAGTFFSVSLFDALLLSWFAFSQSDWFQLVRHNLSVVSRDRTIAVDGF